MRYEESLPHEMEAEIARAPIAYVPWGAHEYHGPHNPVGLDGIKAQFLAEELCDETGGVLFPTVYCGHTTLGALGFPWGIEFGGDTITALARDYLKELPGMGFKLIVFVLGHWGLRHGEIVRREVREFNDRQHSAHAWAVQENEVIEEFGFTEDHGGAGETSLIMARLPGKVDLSRLPEYHEFSIEKDGMFGVDPRTGASARRGREAAEVYVREASARVRQLLSTMEVSDEP